MEPSTEGIVRFVTLIAMLIGLFGMVIPIFPGPTVIWVTALIYGIVRGFTPVGIGLFSIISVLALAGSLADNVLMGAQARQSGAPWRSIAIGMAAGLVGSFIIPIIGGPLLALLALFLAEYFRRQNRDEAWAATRSMAIGCGWAFVVRFGIGVTMIGLWVIWAFVV